MTHESKKPKIPLCYGLIGQATNPEWFDTVVGVMSRKKTGLSPQDQGKDAPAKEQESAIPPLIQVFRRQDKEAGKNPKAWRNKEPKPQKPREFVEKE